VENSKYLGIILDEKLDWKEHIIELNKKLTKTVQAFKIVSRYLSNESKYKIFYAYFHSRVQYGSELYCTANTNAMKSVQIKQNRALKALFHKDFYTPTPKLHNDLKIAMVNDTCEINTLKLVHKIQNGKAPEAFDGYFIQNKDIPGRRQGTRQDEDLSTHQFKTPITQKTFKYRGAKLWNSVDKAVQNTETTKTFGKSLAQSRIANYPNTN